MAVKGQRNALSGCGKKEESDRWSGLELRAEKHGRRTLSSKIEAQLIWINALCAEVI
jgi:hypothetical protein